MASLLDLLSPYPILETLVSVLPLGDLFNLSKTNSSFRAALHGFPVSFRPNHCSWGRKFTANLLNESITSYVTISFGTIQFLLQVLSGIEVYEIDNKARFVQYIHMQDSERGVDPSSSITRAQLLF